MGRTQNEYAESPNSPALRFSLRGHDDAVFGLAFSWDGRILSSTSQDKTIRLWNASTGELLRKLRHNEVLRCAAWSPDGKTLASGDRAGGDNIHLWNAETGELLKALACIVHRVS